jgi:hypothetical protein
MRTFLMVLVCFACAQLTAQDRTLTLKHKSTGSVYEVDPEKAIKCKLVDGAKKRGYIQSLTEEAIVVNGDTVNLEDIVILSSWHTRKNSSAKTGGILLTSLGGLLTAAGVVIISESIQQDEEGTVAVGVPLGAAATAVGIGTTYLGIRALKRKRFDMMEWDMRVDNY